MIGTFIRAVREGSEPVFWAGVLHLAWLPVLLVLTLVDERMILGLNPWIKPMKFILSTVIFLATAGFLIQELGHPPGSSLIGWVIAISMVVENTLINLQSFRGVRSHFNSDSPWNAAIFLLMGIFIVASSGAMLGLLIASFRAPMFLTAGYLWGIRLGIAIFLIGSAQAGFMLRVSAHTMGAPDGGAGLPFLNWSTKYGDLRIGHFFGLHAIQILPLIGWLADRWASHNPALIVTVASIFYLGMVVLFTLQALSGKPLFF